MSMKFIWQSFWIYIFTIIFILSDKVMLTLLRNETSRFKYFPKLYHLDSIPSLILPQKLYKAKLGWCLGKKFKTLKLMFKTKNLFNVLLTLEFLIINTINIHFFNMKIVFRKVIYGWFSSLLRSPHREILSKLFKWYIPLPSLENTQYS